MGVIDGCGCWGWNPAPLWEQVLFNLSQFPSPTLIAILNGVRWNLGDVSLVAKDVEHFKILAVLSLWLCSIVWDQVLWYLWCCFHYLGLLCLGPFVLSCKFLEFLFYLCVDYHWDFKGDCVLSVDYIQQPGDCHMLIWPTHENRGSFCLLMSLIPSVF